MITNKILGIFGEPKSLKEILDDQKGLSKQASTEEATTETVEPSEDELKEATTEETEVKEASEEAEEIKVEAKEESDDDDKEEKEESDDDDKEEKSDDDDDDDDKEDKESCMASKFKCPKCSVVTASAGDQFQCSGCGAKLKAPAKLEKETKETCASEKAFTKLSALTPDQKSMLGSYWKKLYPAAYVDAMLSNY